MTRYLLSAAAAALLLAAPANADELPPLHTGVDATFAPHAFPNLSGGGYQGFNIDLANEFAKRLKRKITIDATQYSGLLPGMQAGTYDFIAAPTTVTKERAENMLFTEGYLNTDFQFLIKKGSPKVDKLEDLKGKTIAVNKGSVYESWAHGLDDKIGWTVEAFGTQTDAVQAVLVGRADANVAGNTAIAWAVKNSPQLELSYLYSTGLVWAAPVRKDLAELRNALDVAVECMKLDGTIAKMHEKWFGVPPAPGSAAVTVFPGYGVPDMPGYDPTPHTPSCS
jgi:polar amino acid transport system substrate-binding protein